MRNEKLQEKSLVVGLLTVGGNGSTGHHVATHLKISPLGSATYPSSQGKNQPGSVVGEGGGPSDESLYSLPAYSFSSTIILLPIYKTSSSPELLLVVGLEGGPLAYLVVQFAMRCRDDFAFRLLFLAKACRECFWYKSLPHVQNHFCLETLAFNEELQKYIW